MVDDPSREHKIEAWCLTSTRMNSSILAAFASLFLILAATAFGSFGSNGFTLDIATAPTECGDARYVIVTVEPNHTVNLHAYGHHVPTTDLRSRLDEIFRTRAERVMWLRGEPNVRVEQVAAVIDAASPVVEIISLLTPGVEAEARARTGMCCLGVSTTASRKFMEKSERTRSQQR